MSIRILIADDHRVVREGLRSLLEKQANMSVVGEASDGREAIQLARKLEPDIVIMDISMPELNGIEATRQVTSEIPGIKVIALSMHSEERFITEMFKAGASGYLLKDCAFKELIIAIRAIIENQTYLPPQVAGIVVNGFVNPQISEHSHAFSKLTEREREVLQLIAEGKSTKEIASILNVSVKTADAHRQRIMKKLDMRSVAELTKYAIREGITSLEV